ncbi:MAG: UDP-N-acetylglucosamine 1-carboxyvinyltransferase [Verrucomicrobiota bacterium]|nr:UDP-N-acetylglucosamine 1-carboxyvinyltransferase [Verrucomicrobiota bacterium]MEC8244542.1 UDP-N-acetylglucosamine 1-carboxyvinyltransferase [Verrucomicrobiota bacterium]
MDIFRICGGLPLRGEVKVSGSKNSALPLFAASLLTDDETILENVPNLSDINFMAEILTEMGAEVYRIDSNSWKIRPTSIVPYAPYELVRKMRASICLLGPLVARLKKAEIPMPGGCVIGNRPIDLHVRALQGLGADVQLSGGVVKVDGKNIAGNSIFIGGRNGSTVTGTANAIMLAVLTPGHSVLEGSACEPEITDLCNMLVSMGANIEGIGSHLLKINGVKKLHGCTHTVIPDRIEAGTYIIAGAMTGGDMTIDGIEHAHMGSFLDLLRSSGLNFDLKENKIQINKNSNLNPLEVVTLPFPGFPTDLQAQICALASLTPGLSVITERVYPSRFMHVPELLRMGAHISLEGSSAIIRGSKKLTGAPVMASDLRASAALILAGLAATGETWVQRIYHLDRGYENFEQKLSRLGANVERLPESELPKSISSSNNLMN